MLNALALIGPALGAVLALISIYLTLWPGPWGGPPAGLGTTDVASALGIEGIVLLALFAGLVSGLASVWSCVRGASASQLRFATVTVSVNALLTVAFGVFMVSLG